MSLRRALSWLRPRSRAPRPLILMYHRVTTLERDIWDLAVTPDRFEQQIANLAAKRDLIELEEFAALHKLGRLPKRAAAITFDDGYACNAENAAPILASYGAPSTFFLSSGSIGSHREFWYDELERIIFGTDCSDVIELRSDHASIHVALGKLSTDDLLPWKAYRETPRTSRQRAYLEVWRFMKPLLPTKQQSILEMLRQKTNSTNAPRPANRSMNELEIVSLLRNPKMSIGAHTVNHVSLPAHDISTQVYETRESVTACDSLAGRPTRTFAYPYGDHSPETMRCLAEAGLEIAVSTEGRGVRPEDVLLALPRIQVMQADRF